ncbi:MAG: hypothetical protein WED34_16560 [Planctomycetales bacterium]
MKSAETNHSLLSAWFDGEASAEEAAAAERLLAESPAARREVADYARLSAWLRELPASSPPAVLPRDLLCRAPAGNGQADRPSVLPMSDGRTDRRSVLPKLRGRASAWVALVVSAAVLLLCVGLLRKHGEREPAQQFADADDSHGSGLPLASSDPGRDGEVAEMALAKAAEEPPAAAPRRALDGDPPGAAIAGNDLEAESGRIVRRQLDALQFREGPPEAGDLLRFVERNADEVSVIEVTVVDVQQGARAIELLLARNAIPPADGEKHAAALRRGTGAAGDPPSRLGSSKSPETERGLTAVYVEATEPQFAAALAQIAREPFVVALHAEAPDAKSRPGGRGGNELDTARFNRRLAPLGTDEPAESSLADRLAAPAADPRRPATGPAPRVRALPAAAGAADATIAGTGAANPRGDESRGAKDGSWQMRLQLPESAARKLAAEERSAAQAPARSKPDEPEGVRSLADEALAQHGAEQRAEQPTVRVLFLLRPGSASRSGAK